MIEQELLQQGGLLLLGYLMLNYIIKDRRESDQEHLEISKKNLDNSTKTLDLLVEVKDKCFKKGKK